MDNSTSEGDRLLSIVLSKAFLLANDTQISGPSIVQQIRGYSTRKSSLTAKD